MDYFDFIKTSSAGTWSDNETDSKGTPWDHIPAGEEYQPDADLLKAEEPYHDESIENQPFPTDCTIEQRFACLIDALKLFRNKFTNDRAFLIWIGRYFLKLKLNTMEDIFRLDLTNISRVARKADKKIKVRG